jgi:cobalt-zinc-cadmium efflux system outer membrane protein
MTALLRCTFRGPSDSRFFIATAFGLLFAPAVGIAQVTEAEALERALSRPAVRDVVEGDVDVARADAIRAGLWANPTVAYTREHTSGGSPASNEDFAQIAQAFDVSGRRGLRTSAAERRVEVARLRGASLRVQLEGDVRTRFYDLVLAQGRVGAAQDALQRLDPLVGLVGRRAAAGDVSGYDRQRIEREGLFVRARVDAETAQMSRTRERLAAVLGDAPATDLRVAGDLLPSMPAPIDVAAILRQRPDLRALGEEAAAGDLEGGVGRRGWVPDLQLAAGFKGSSAAGERADGFTLGIAVPLPIFDRLQDASLRGAGRVRAARGRLAIEEAAAAGDMRALHAEALQLAEAARRFLEGATQASRDLLATAEAAYRGGELGILELVDAYRGALDTDLQALDLAFAARRARIDLDLATAGASR